MPDIKQIQWGQDNALENAPVLSAEEQDTLKKKMEAMDKLLSEQQKAKYKIELFMNGKERGLNRPYGGILCIWESGTKLHGGGDEKVYECPAESFGYPPCNGLMGSSFQGYGHLVCPLCKRVWKGEQVHGDRIARLSIQNWAHLTYNYFIRLNHNADIYLKYLRYDLHAAAAIELDKDHGGEKLGQVRIKRMKVIYPLKNLIKDTASGKDILSCLRSFLAA